MTKTLVPVRAQFEKPDGAAAAGTVTFAPKRGLQDTTTGEFVLPAEIFTLDTNGKLNGDTGVGIRALDDEGMIAGAYYEVTLDIQDAPRQVGVLFVYVADAPDGVELAARLQLTMPGSPPGAYVLLPVFRQHVNTTIAAGAHGGPVSGGGHTIEDEGTPLPARAKLNFLGAGVMVTDNPGAGATDVTIPGGGGEADLGGDVTGPEDATVVVKIQGQDVSSATPLTNQILLFSAGMIFTGWRPVYLTNALNLITAGDMIYAGGGGSVVQLNIGTAKQVLTVDPITGLPLWLPPAGDLLAANNLSDVADAATALGNLGGATAASVTSEAATRAAADSAEAAARASADSTHAALTTGAHGGIVASTDSRLTDARTPTGTAGGDLSGTYPNPGLNFGGALAVVTNLIGAVARVIVSKAGSVIGKRRQINFIEGANVTLTITDDGAGEKVDVTIAAAGGSDPRITGSGSLALGAFAGVLPASGTQALLGTANVFTAAQEIDAPSNTPGLFIINNNGGGVAGKFRANGGALAAVYIEAGGSYGLFSGGGSSGSIAIVASAQYQAAAIPFEAWDVNGTPTVRITQPGDMLFLASGRGPVIKDDNDGHTYRLGSHNGAITLTLVT